MSMYRVTHHASHITHHASCITHHASRIEGWRAVRQSMSLSLSCVVESGERVVVEYECKAARVQTVNERERSRRERSRTMGEHWHFKSARTSPLYMSGKRQVGTDDGS